MSEVNKNVIMDIIKEDKDRLKEIIDGTIIEFSELLWDRHTVFAEIIINHEMYQLENAYKIIANQFFKQDLDFSKEYNHDLFNEFIDDLNYCLDEVLGNYYYDYWISYGFSNSGFGLLVDKV